MITLQTEFANRKGKILRGTVTLPGAAGPYPVVVNLHGFGGSRMGYKSMHVSMARELAAAGIACVRYDFYGNGESDGEFEEMTFTSLLEGRDARSITVTEITRLAGVNRTTFYAN